MILKAKNHHARTKLQEKKFKYFVYGQITSPKKYIEEEKNVIRN